jgi:uncharacterized Zn finger protein (UPF0148 family)
MTDTLLTYTGKLTVTTCPECFVPHGIPRELYADRLNNGGSVYCPNGHKWHFITSEVDKLRRKLAAAEQQRDWARSAQTAERDQRQAAERSASSFKGQATRLRNRAAAGVCPCCNRTFANMARHMSGQHPGFAAESDA